MIKRLNIAAVHWPLKGTALCLDCEHVFHVGPDACPSCTSTSWVPLAQLTKHLPQEVS